MMTIVSRETPRGRQLSPAKADRYLRRRETDLAGAPRPTRSHVTTIDGRSPGSRLIASRRLPRTGGPSGVSASARRLQLRGQPRLWTGTSPHRVPFQSPRGTIKRTLLGSAAPRQLPPLCVIFMALSNERAHLGSAAAGLTASSRPFFRQHAPPRLPPLWEPHYPARPFSPGSSPLPLRPNP
jgi:hypothetical protein